MSEDNEQQEYRKIKVLLVDDQPEFIESFIELMEYQGYIIYYALNASEALDMFRREKPDISLIDYHMPGKDGIELTAEIKAIDPNVPVILLTNDGSGELNLKYSNSLANDYIVKTMGYAIICARMNKLLKERDLKHNGLFHISYLDIDYAKMRVLCNSKEIILSTLEYKLLEYFARNYGIRLHKDEIIKHVFKDQYTGDEDTLRVIISHLNSKLNEDGEKLIHNKYGGYYYFEKKY